MSRLDLAQTKSFSNDTYAAGTVGATHIHDNMDAFAVGFQIQDDNPAAKNFATTDINITTDAINIAGHGYKNGLMGQVTTTSALPAGLVTNTNYFAIRVDAANFKLASSRALALAGTAIDITGVGVGTHNFKPTALAGLDVHLERSIDGNVWADIPGSTLAAAGLDVQSYAPAAYGYVRAEMTLTSGQVQMTVKVRSRGDA